MSLSPAGRTLTPKRLRELRAQAHALKPVVWVSQNGISEGALREVDRALTAHELIKIHAALDDRKAREALLATLCQAVRAEPVQVIGKTLIAFRQRPQEPERSTRASRQDKPPRVRPAARPRPGPAAKRRAPARRSRPTI